ncbi:MAG TPA: hypothetical protein PLF01_06815 [Alphaproteobacteria bacterium]|nr:hypothetical protein [Alphaproteobacteria bacterium]
MSKEPEKSEGTFDIYHFFSRKDIIIAAILIIALLIYFVVRYLAPAAA